MKQKVTVLVKFKKTYYFDLYLNVLKSVKSSLFIKLK